MLQYISFDFQITYHEVEPSGFEQNADSSSIYVAEEYFSLSNLQPGRNYSISVQAVSKGIESVQRSLFQATRKYRSLISGLKSLHFASFLLYTIVLQDHFICIIFYSYFYLFLNSKYIKDA